MVAEFPTLWTVPAGESRGRPRTPLPFQGRRFHRGKNPGKAGTPETVAFLRPGLLKYIRKGALQKPKTCFIFVIPLILLRNRQGGVLFGRKNILLEPFSFLCYPIQLDEGGKLLPKHAGAYKGEKRRKEVTRQKKQEERRLRRLQNKGERPSSATEDTEKVEQTEPAHP